MLTKGCQSFAHLIRRELNFVGCERTSYVPFTKETYPRFQMCSNHNEAAMKIGDYLSRLSHDSTLACLARSATLVCLALTRIKTHVDGSAPISARVTCTSDRAAANFKDTCEFQKLQTNRSRKVRFVPRVTAE